MTTPFERTRAVVETMHLLRQLLTGQSPATSLGDLQNVASALLRHYPDETSPRLSAAAPISVGRASAPRD